jgi:hypothetical protein
MDFKSLSQNRNLRWMVSAVGANELHCLIPSGAGPVELKSAAGLIEMSLVGLAMLISGLIF